MAIPVTATTITPTVPVAASQEAAAPTIAADGRVKLQASAIRPATPQCTAASRRPAPAPKIEPVHTCVVDSGSPRWVEVRITAALVVSAAKPWTGLDVADPPAEGSDDPPAAQVGAERDRQPGGQRRPRTAVPSRAPACPEVIRVNVITPMVFCASLVPCASATIEEETV